MTKSMKSICECFKSRPLFFLIFYCLYYVSMCVYIMSVCICVCVHVYMCALVPWRSGKLLAVGLSTMWGQTQV